ncbi:MAG: kinase-like domain-containing protein [Benjaminiella poitrasii]|nr:MAG: kinase-like domain-containing protein [Benjaminiella poitrasii]
MSSSVARNQKAKLAADYNELLKELTSPKVKDVGCYTLGETIGKGSYGKVKLGMHKLTRRRVAIKQINKQHAHLMAREIHHHRQLHHPNIVSLYEILSTETNIYIVSEHCAHGDLFDALSRHGRFDEFQVRSWFLQLLDAIQYCHLLGIIHRDLKLENILLDENDNVKICDFGFARQTDKNQLLKTFCGSLAYSAPEVIQHQNYSGPATDIWSLGIILFILLAGELPFDDDCEFTLQKKVVNIDYIIPSFFSEDVADLIRHILKLNPYERLSISQILQHPWLTNQSQTSNQSNHNRTVITKQQEQETVSSLVHSGFDRSVVEEMRSSHFGMLGTIWTMLLESRLKLSSHETADENENENEGWIDTFKSWFVGHKQQTDTKENVTLLNSAKYVSISNSSNRRPAASTPWMSLTPIQDEDEVTNDSTTSNSSQSVNIDDDDDEHSSTGSSPATSFEEEQECDKKQVYDEPIHYPITATPIHRISPIPSRADVLIPRTRYMVDERQTNLRTRLENKMIIEEEEEE